VIAAHLKELQDGLHIAPQTNEPGRSAALLVGLFVAVRQTGLTSVRLLEPGASAGLNLHVDRFRIGGRPAGGSNGTGGEGAPWWSGPDGSPVQLPDAVRGSIQPIDYRIVERAGCDPWPVDIGRSEGRLRLRSFVWPFQVERHERLRSALAVAAVNPVVIEQAGAASWLTRKLAVAPAPGLLTVVWHSITRHYWPAQEARAAAAAVAAAGGRMPLAHISMEYPRVEDGQPAELWVTIHTPGRQSRSCKLGTVGRQGGQVRLVAAASWD
jgi:hypothetical protein